MKFAFTLASLLLMQPALSPALHADELPENSVYRLDAMLETHRDREIPLASLQGQPVIMSMFYGSCPHVCPMLISTIQQVEKQLSPQARGKLRVAMVSIDPKRDTPEHLAAVADQHDVDSDRWLLARTSPAMTRPLAAVLDIKYKALPDGEFNHTSVLVLLGPQGRELARSNKLGSPDPGFVQKVEAALSESAVNHGE